MPPGQRRRKRKEIGGKKEGRLGDEQMDTSSTARLEGLRKEKKRGRGKRGGKAGRGAYCRIIKQKRKRGEKRKRGKGGRNQRQEDTVQNGYSLRKGKKKEGEWKGGNECCCMTRNRGKH